MHPKAPTFRFSQLWLRVLSKLLFVVEVGIFTLPQMLILINDSSRLGIFIDVIDHTRYAKDAFYRIKMGFWTHLNFSKPETIDDNCADYVLDTANSCCSNGTATW